MPQSRASSSYGYNTLYSFGIPYDGQQPKAGLIDLDGTLYGTTYKGGKYGAGTVFNMSTAGSEKVLYSFSAPRKDNDGANPSATLTAIGGVLYGTTEYGGIARYPDGTVFAISTAGNETVLYRFRGQYRNYHFYDDGANPIASLIDVKGKLYGTTLTGGDGSICGGGGCGTVFRISTRGREKVLHSFGYYNDGANPAANLVNVNGTLYGATEHGGGSSYGLGTLFSISLTGAEQTLYNFGYKGPSGGNPVAGLIYVDGMLYGTTPGGGPDYGGTAFSIATSGDLNPIHNFGSNSDGSTPVASLLSVKGTLYGTTSQGGLYGKGTVFSMTLSGNATGSP
jgi:uncharacterized repeat protein (TIGR03803 family)